MSYHQAQKTASPAEDALQQHALQQHQLGQAFDTYERRYGRLERVNFDNSSRRMELRHRLDNLQRHLDRLQESVGLLVEKPTTTTTTTTDSNTSPKKPRGRRKKLHSDVDLDFQALRDQIHYLDVLTEDLRNSDRKQEDAEKSFDNAVHAISTTLRRSKLIPKNEEAADVSLAPTLASASEHPSDVASPIAAELEAYYAAVSTLRNMGERIGELQAEQQEQWERRGVMEDQDQVLEQSEEEFLHMWNDVLQNAYNDFATAQTAVKETREVCHTMEITIPPWADVNSVGDNTGPSSDNATDPGNFGLPDSIPTDSQLDSNKGYPNMFHEPVLQDYESPLATPPILDNPMVKERVARWVDNIEPVVDLQSGSFLPNTSLDLSGDAAPATEQQNDNIAFRQPQWSDKMPISTRSEGAATTMVPRTPAFGAIIAAPRAASTGAERDVDGDCDPRPAAPLPTKVSLQT